MAVRIVPTAIRCRLGEGPTWVPRLNALLWVDIVGRRIHRLDLESDETSSLDLPEPVGWIVERAGRDDYLIGLASGVAVFDLDNGTVERLLPIEPDTADTRLNDAKVDPAGRLWTGTKDDTDRAAIGALYRIMPDLSVEQVDAHYGVTNGPTFSPDGRTLYHTDSAARRVYAFDLDAHGAVRDRRLWLQFEEAWGYPDGMTTDAEGCLWIAHWGGARVSRFSPRGEWLRSIALPVSNVTSCCFAGGALDRLFVTTAMIDEEPDSGALFEVDAGVSGIAPTPFAG
ncbi:SMP-30/gluconolactonase/LRE family protein [Sphingomonas sp. ASV193]|uniref:SMP-30/gluconolactonase/LRE family protein n=1 Tax=Sphingomonas sp. ASV193 TaxID=3144405 RepID=UPI0032E89F23